MTVMQQVESSNIKSIGWNEDKLYVRFKSSERLYCYQGVKKDLYEAFLNAESKGRFFCENVKNKYSHFVID